MRRETTSERSAWTAHIEGTEAARPNKYGANRKNGYASIHEADIAANLQMLHSKGLIKDLKEQVRFVLVPGKGKLRPVIYVADFTWIEPDGTRRVADAKGFKTQVYRLKKRMMELMLGIEILEL